MRAAPHQTNAATALAPARLERLVLLAIVLAGFGVRVYRLGAQSLWYDEGVTAWVARMPLTQMVQWTANDIQPPFYYLLVAGWGQLNGWSEYALRFPSVCAGTLTIVLGWRLVRDWQRHLALRGRAPLWMALLLATHPLLLYYAQEARMYALLNALLLLGALLLTPAFFGGMAWRRWLGYVLVMALAAYTHYFAFFALLAFALAWLLRYATHRADMRRFLTANALIALLYAPWLGIMLRRLGVDASYWLGQLKLREAVRNVARRFVSGESMHEAQAVLIATLVLALTVVGIVLLWRRAPQRRPLLQFALIWLLLPVAAVLLLASFAPKFNPRYVLIALPGLLLLWAQLLDRLATQRTEYARMGLMATLVVLFVPMLWANANWFYAGAFGKAQWRELADYLRPRITAEERVLLVSGHAFPVWAYYAPDMPVVRLPELDVLDVNAVLDFANTAPALRAALAEHPGAWLVGWQDEVVDPNRVVSTQLELGGREKGLSARFNQLTLQRFSQIRTARIADSAPIATTVGAEYGNAVRLEGYRALDNGDLLLFWQRTRANDTADYHFALDVLDANGALLRQVADRRLAGYNDPTFRWQAGVTIMGRIAIEEWLGFTLADFESGSAQPAESYTLRLRVYNALDNAHTPLLLPDGADALQISGVEPILE